MKLRHELRIRWMLGLIGAGAFATLLALEIVTEEMISPLKLLLESLELALTVAAAGGFTLLFGRLRQQHEEKLALINDLAVATAEGDRWRHQVQTHLEGTRHGNRAPVRRLGLSEAESEVALLMSRG